MPCTTILVGKDATNDRSTMIARTDDGFFDVKKTVVVEPEKQPKKYKSVISHVEVALPETLQVLLNPNVSVTHGQSGAIVYLAQVILTILSDNYHCVPSPPITGILDDATRDALEHFQQLCGLPITGDLDRHTWKHLALQFPMASNLPISEGTREVYGKKR